MFDALCLGLNAQFGAPLKEQVRLIRDAGFDEIFFDRTSDEEGRVLCAEARRLGVPVQSVHAPYGGSRRLWEADEAAARESLQELLDCLTFCAEAGVPIMVCHAFIGFGIPPIPKEKGLERYGFLIKEAQKRGVTLAFENTEGEEYLDALLHTFQGEKNVGFCWDSGHEACYNPGRDMLKDHGDLLVCTHINDNLGVSAENGTTTWHDDLHLLPFDGRIDWEERLTALAKTPYRGTLTFELNTRSKPGRHENDAYAALPLPDYLSLCYERAGRIRNLLRKQLKNVSACDKMD